jgi:uncharacterized protein YceK
VGEAAEFAAGLAAERDAEAAERAAQVALVREVFGNPFRPVRVDPAWLAWHGGTIPRLARAIYGDGAFDRLLVLADALEEAGCGDPDVLGHLRGPRGVHIRGCFALDAVLGKGRRRGRPTTTAVGSPDGDPPGLDDCLFRLDFPAAEITLVPSHFRRGAMRARGTAGFAALTAVALVGCGTIRNLAGGDPDIYGGVRRDFRFIQTPQSVSGVGVNPMTLALLAPADLCLSLVADTLTLPLAVYLRQNDPTGDSEGVPNGKSGPADSASPGAPGGSPQSPPSSLRSPP